MPTTKSAKKRLRQNKKRRERNRIIKGHLRELEEKIREADSSEDLEGMLKQYFSEVDKAAKKDVIHKNKANRKKSQLSTVINKKKE